MAVEVRILSLIHTSSMFALVLLPFVRRLVHLVFDVFPQYVAFGKFFENIVPILISLGFLDGQMC